MNIKEYLEEQGFHPAPRLAEADTWLGWYKGRVKDFHDYKVYNGQNFVGRTRASMQMAKKVCEDWANLILNEKVEITSADEKFNNTLQEVLQQNDFFFRANQLVELTMALGTGAFVEYLDNGTVAIDYIREEMIYPLSWDNGSITECAFASVRHVGGKKAYYLNIHALEAGGYVIQNKLVNAEGKELELPKGVAPEIVTNSYTPRFQIITPNLVNNVDLDSPYGISVFANSIGRLQKVDLIFDSGDNEFSLGRKRIILPLTMAQIKIGEGSGKPVFDANDVAFYGLNIMGKKGDANKPIDLTGELRIEEHSKGMQDALNYLSDGCGLGTDRYEYTRSGGVKTATEVISEKSALYQNLRKHELVLEQAIKNLATAVGEMLGMGAVEVSVNFDDSIIQDEDAIRNRALLEYNANLIDAVEYFMITDGITEEEAIKKVEKIEDRKPELPGEDHFNPFDIGEE